MCASACDAGNLSDNEGLSYDMLTLSFQIPDITGSRKLTILFTCFVLLQWSGLCEMRCYRNTLGIAYVGEIKSQMTPSDKSEQERDIYGHSSMQEAVALGGYLSYTRWLTGEDSTAGICPNIRQRGRPPKKWTDNITEWTDLTPCEAVWLSQDRVTCNKIVFGPQWFLTKGHEEEEQEEEEKRRICESNVWVNKQVPRIFIQWTQVLLPVPARVSNVAGTRRERWPPRALPDGNSRIADLGRLLSRSRLVGQSPRTNCGGCSYCSAENSEILNEQRWRQGV